MSEKTITPEQMVKAGKLMTVEQARQYLRPGDNLTQVELPLGGGTAFHLEDLWWQNIESKGADAPVDVFVDVERTGAGKRTFQFTKEAALEAISEVGLPKAYVTRTPGRLVEPHLNYWYDSPDRQLKLMVDGDQVRGVTKLTLTPFSNLTLLNRALAGIEARYGPGPVYVDKKSVHRPSGTQLLLVVPAAQRAIRPDDNWCGGIQVKNSLTGDFATALNGYLFRWWCTNGAITKHRTSGAYSRRGTAGHDDSVYDWARRAVDSVLGELDEEFDRVEELAEMPIPGEVGDTLNQLFDRYRLSQPVRRAIRNNMLESSDLTVYGIMQSVTAAANRIPDSRIRELLMGIGGDLVQSGGRCAHCHRVSLDPSTHE